MTNLETALKAETKNVVRSWYELPLTYRPPCTLRPPSGRYIYTHPAVPDTCYRSRREAAEAALKAAA